MTHDDTFGLGVWVPADDAPKTGRRAIGRHKLPDGSYSNPSPALFMQGINGGDWIMSDRGGRKMQPPCYTYPWLPDGNTVFPSEILYPEDCSFILSAIKTVLLIPYVGDADRYSQLTLLLGRELRELRQEQSK